MDERYVWLIGTPEMKNMFKFIRRQDNSFTNADSISTFREKHFIDIWIIIPELILRNIHLDN